MDPRLSLTFLRPSCTGVGVTDDEKRQLDKFKEAVRILEGDDDNLRFKERLKKGAKHKPVGKPDAPG